MKAIAILLLISGLTVGVIGCGEQAKPINTTNAPTVEPQDSGMGKGAAPPGAPGKAVGGRSIPKGADKP
jgi:hypothetical protein